MKMFSTSKINTTIVSFLVFFSIFYTIFAPSQVYAMAQMPDNPEYIYVLSSMQGSKYFIEKNSIETFGDSENNYLSVIIALTDGENSSFYHTTYRIPHNKDNIFFTFDMLVYVGKNEKAKYIKFPAMWEKLAPNTPLEDCYLAALNL